MSKNMHFVMTFNTCLQIALWKGCTILTSLWPECPFPLASSVSSSYCFKGVLENCWYSPNVSAVGRPWIQSLGQMLPYLGVFSKAAFISPVLFSGLVANKHSTKYLMMVNGVLVNGDSPWDHRVRHDSGIEHACTVVSEDASISFWNSFCTVILVLKK